MLNSFRWKASGALQSESMFVLLYQITLNYVITCNKLFSKTTHKYFLFVILGIAIGSTCVSMFELINYILLLITLVISCAALGLIIHTKRQVSDTIEPNKPEQSPSRNTSQNRIASNQREPPSLEELQAGPLPRKQTGATISNMDSIDTEA